VATRSKAWGLPQIAGWGLRVWIPPGVWSSFSSECCVLSDSSASGWSPVQRSLTECIVSDYDLETPTMRRSGPTTAVEPWKKLNLLDGCIIWYLKSFSSASCTVGRGSFPGVQRPWRGVALSIHLPAPWLKKDGTYSSTPTVYNHGKLYAEL